MKATGIVRRIDDLGRVVIPKEIRRTMRIREGDPLEIYTEKDGEVIFKKYSPMGELDNFASQICETLHKSTGHICAISDRDTIIAISGAPRKELLEHRISKELEKLMEDRQMFTSEKGSAAIPVCDTTDAYHITIASPIAPEGDIMGSVLFLSTSADDPTTGEVEYKIAEMVAGFLGKQMES